MSKPAAYLTFAALALFLGCAKANFVPREDQGDSDADTCLTPIKPKPNCQALTSSPCDPVCQSGSCNWCSQKCSLAGDATPVCAGWGNISSGNTCTVYLAATPQQHDECGPGDICLSPDVGGSVSYCFTLCHSEVDCVGNVACAFRAMGPMVAGTTPSAKVCDPEYVSCDPASATACCDPLASSAASSGCASGRFCYLVTADSTGHSRTTCEYNTGGGGRGAACQSSRDCLEKYVCAPSGAGTSGTCQRVCSGTTPCTSGTCVLLGAEYGYCPL